jgi:hypothetical protein
MEICCNNVHFAIAFLQAWEGLKKEGKIFFWRFFHNLVIYATKNFKKRKILDFEGFFAI